MPLISYFFDSYSCRCNKGKQALSLMNHEMKKAWHNPCMNNAAAKVGGM